MKRQKFTHRKDKSLKQNVIFCAECGEELELFGLTGDKINIKKVKERHKRCREIGKFKGDKCAMLFIAEESDIILPSDEED
ncbi:MAG: hypothetical protein M1495_13940 [Bacteroidetes bacterium]|nr:hypothetical protein [Bacteroidota bacterium]